MDVDEDASDEHDDVLFGPCAPQNQEHAAGAGNATSGKGLRWGGAGQAVRSAACLRRCGYSIPLIACATLDVHRGVSS